MKNRTWSVAAIAASTAVLLNACQASLPTNALSGEAGSTKRGKPVITPDGTRNIANNCFTCHGPNGRSLGSIPSLTALSASDIASQLKHFKRGDVSSTIMGRLAKGYSDAEIEAVANYIAGLGK